MSGGAVSRVDVGFSRLSQMVFGYWQAGCLFALADAGVFGVLGRGSLAAGPLAVRVGCDREALTALLDAGVALGLLSRDGDGCYGNSSVAARFLDPAGPESLDEWVRTMGQWYPSWAYLPRWVRDPGEAKAVVESGTGGADERTFILGMHRYAQRTAGEVAGVVEVPVAEGLLLDVGGGAGTYAIALCEANPGLRAVVLDRPTVAPITVECAGAAGLGDRVTAESFDYRLDTPPPADVILFSNVLHQEPPETATAVLTRARHALNNGGTILIHDYLLDETRTAPLFSTLQNVSLMMLWGAGRSYTVEEMAGLATSAGLTVRAVTQVPTAKSTVLVLGVEEES